MALGFIIKIHEYWLRENIRKAFAFSGYDNCKVQLIVTQIDPSGVYIIIGSHETPEPAIIVENKMAEVSKYSLNYWLPYIGSFFWLLSFSFWVVLWFLNPYSIEKVPNIITIPGVFMAIFCLIGVAVSIRRKPVLMALVSILSFFPIGCYLLFSPGIFKIIGWLNIVCFVISLFMFYSLRSEKHEIAKIS